MASQISHIIYAHKYFEKYLAKPAFKDEFVLGCVFPDIRRIEKNLKRRDTHLCFSLLNLNFSGLTPFQAGCKFHMYCDMKREEILNKYKFYSLENIGIFEIIANKLVEDELLYDECNNWEKVAHYFNNAPKIETGIDIAQETIGLWYAIIAKYIEKKPNKKTMRIFLTKMPGLMNKAAEIMESVDNLRKNEKVIEILRKIKNEIIQ
jgi:hypothetical protein